MKNFKLLFLVFALLVPSISGASSYSGGGAKPVVSNITHDVDTSHCPVANSDVIYLTIEDDGALGTTWNMLFSGMTPGKPIWVFINGFLDSSSAALPSSLSRTGMTIPLQTGDYFYLQPISATAYRMIDGTVGMGRFVPFAPDELDNWVDSTTTTMTNVDCTPEVRKGAYAIALRTFLFESGGSVPPVRIQQSGDTITNGRFLTASSPVSTAQIESFQVRLNDDGIFQACFSSSWTYNVGTDNNQVFAVGYWI